MKMERTQDKKSSDRTGRKSISLRGVSGSALTNASRLQAVAEKTGAQIK